MATAKRKKTSANARKNTPRSSERKTRAAKSKSAKRLTTTTVSAMAKKARAATRLGKAAAVLLVGAAAGAVRAVIPQLEKTAQSGGKLARGTKAGQTNELSRPRTGNARASA